MVVKKIELELEFPDDFAPPEKFEQTGKCVSCPLYTYDSGYELSDCSAGGYEECPLKKQFDKK